MRHLWLVFFAGFLYLSIVFITQNLDPIVIRFNLDELGLNFRFERPIFVPIFVTLALVSFSVWPTSSLITLNSESCTATK